MPDFRNAARLLCLTLGIATTAGADPIPVKHLQGEVHGYLTVRDDDGKLVGYADDFNVRAGRTWRARLTIHFLDGSLSDETTVYTQSATLHLLTDHLVQKGPSFPKATDLTIDTVKGQVTYREGKDGKDELKTEAMKMPADLSNGIIPLTLQNVSHEAEVKVSFIVTTPKPHLVKFAIHPGGQASYKAGTIRTANHFRIHVEIGGIEGVVAPIVGKEPPDMDAWVSSGEAPSLLKLRAFLFEGGPLWTLQLASPEW